jgi:hypothetical protein
MFLENLAILPTVSLPHQILPLSYLRGNSLAHKVRERQATLLSVHQNRVHSVDLPVTACGTAKLGMVAASWGMELRSGSGVLCRGERANEVMRTGDLSCKRAHLVNENRDQIQNLSWMPGNYCDSIILPQLSTVQLWGDELQIQVQDSYLG